MGLTLPPVPMASLQEEFPRSPLPLGPQRTCVQQDLSPTCNRMSSQLEAELPSERADIALFYQATGVRINVLLSLC